MNTASNVISARARAMYGKALTDADFQSLLSCRTVSEIARYLKETPAYRDTLAGLNDATMHRGYLEERLHKRLWDCYATLIRFDMSSGQRLSGYLMQREETVHLMQLLRRMNIGQAQEYVFSLPSFFVAHTQMDLLAINRAKTVRQLVEALSGTVYQKLLAPFADCPNGELPIAEMETVLYTHVSRLLLTVIQNTSGRLREELTALCGTNLDAQNVARIWRLKTYFHAGPEEIRRQLLPFGGDVRPAMWDKMLHAEPDEVLELFFATPAGRHIPPAERVNAFDLPERAAYFTARHYIHFSVYPMVVLLSYLTVTETEIMDIINIIEGVRYQLPPEDILPTLIVGKKGRE